jgi:hypothetical protein
MNYQKGGMDVYSSTEGQRELEPDVDRLTNRELRILFPESNNIFDLSYRQKSDRLRKALNEGTVVYDEKNEIQLSDYYRLTDEGLLERKRVLDQDRRSLAQDKRIETAGRISQAFPRWF